MRTASILLAMVIVLGFVREAGAQSDYVTEHDYRFSISGQTFGFVDGADYDTGVREPWSLLHLGPLGYQRVPFTATQGLVGLCSIVVAFIALLVVTTVRRRKRLNPV